MCLDVGVVSELCHSIAPMCLDVGAVSEKCRSIAPMCLDVGAVYIRTRDDEVDFGASSSSRGARCEAALLHVGECCELVSYTLSNEAQDGIVTRE